MTLSDLKPGDRVKTHGFAGMDAVTAMMCEQSLQPVEMTVIAVGGIKVKVRSASGRTFVVHPSDLMAVERG